MYVLWYTFLNLFGFPKYFGSLSPQLPPWYNTGLGLQHVATTSSIHAACMVSRRFARQQRGGRSERFACPRPGRGKSWGIGGCCQYIYTIDNNITFSDPDTEDGAPLSKTNRCEEQVGTCYIQQVANTPRLPPACDMKSHRLMLVEPG